MNKNLFALVLLAACGGKTDFVGGDDDGDDTGGAIVCDGLPKVTHEEFRDAQQGGVAVLIEAEVVADPQEGCEDKSLVGVWLYYKTQTDSDYRTPIQLTSSDGFLFSGSIAGPEVSTGSMLYYFKAVGESGDTVDPEGADEKFSEAYSFGVSL